MPRFSNEERGIFLLTVEWNFSLKLQGTISRRFTHQKRGKHLRTRLFLSLFLSTVRIDDDSDRPVVDELDIHHRAEYAGFDLEAVAYQFLIEFQP